MSEAFEKMSRLLDSGVRNIVQASNDEFQKKNADFRAKAGLEVTITREALGECCSWCSDLEGTYTYENAPDDIYARHRECNCVVSTKTKKGTYQDAWSRKHYNSYRENRIARAEELGISQNSIDKKSRIRLEKIMAQTKYNGGIPKNWKVFEPSAEDALLNANPNYNPFIENEYSRNCSNSVVAYEMRRRGFDVVARPQTRNHYLEYYPEAAWEGINEAKIIRTAGSGKEDIINVMEDSLIGARYEISFKITQDIGHVIVAERRGSGIILMDPQKGKEVSMEIFDYVVENETRLWRIDNAVISDRGITAVQVR